MPSVSYNHIYYRTRNGIEVIFITDIAKAGSKPETALWKFDTLKENIKSGKINILRFNLLDVEVYFLNLIRDCTLVNDFTLLHLFIN